MPGIDCGAVGISGKRLSDKMRHDKKLSRHFREREGALQMQE
jgi:hypothetical protein